jgi:hypothetical protein
MMLLSRARPLLPVPPAARYAAGWMALSLALGLLLTRLPLAWGAAGIAAAVLVVVAVGNP